jgi:hypothetical protein
MPAQEGGEDHLLNLFFILPLVLECGVLETEVPRGLCHVLRDVRVNVPANTWRESVQPCVRRRQRTVCVYVCVCASER